MQLRDVTEIKKRQSDRKKKNASLEQSSTWLNCGAVKGIWQSDMNKRILDKCNSWGYSSKTVTNTETLRQLLVCERFPLNCGWLAFQCSIHWEERREALFKRHSFSAHAHKDAPNILPGDAGAFWIPGEKSPRVLRQVLKDAVGGGRRGRSADGEAISLF